MITVLIQAPTGEVDIETVCSRCGEQKDDVERRYSFGYYAGRLCRQCAIEGYRDHCGEDMPQGRGEDLDEFQYGGYAALDGD